MPEDDRITGPLSMFADVNKVKAGQTQDTLQGPVSSYLPELTLSMDDAELIRLKKKWENAWTASKADLEKRQKEAEKYWLGKNYTNVREMDRVKPMADNLIFEALETFLPKATAKSPEPVVTADNSPEGQELSTIVEKMLRFLADNHNVNLRMTLRQVARFHQLYFLGVAKVGWSERLNNITVQAVRPQKLILDPDSSIENGRYTGQYVGEYRQETASNLIARFPKKEKFIKEECQGKLGTKLQYIEWWAKGDEFAVFWTLKDEVLAKIKNPHFNYDSEQDSVDEMGQPTKVTVPGRNFFEEPEFPYAFLSVMNLGNKPYDETNGLFQCLSMQDVVTKRWKQIDRNADNTNNGLIVSGMFFDEGQAAQAAEALRMGDVLYQPTGTVGEGVKRETGPALPEFIYQNLLDARARILSVYGVSGSVPSSLQKDKTVRGKMITRAADDDRIGGGFTEYLEQVADQIFNQMVQFMYVYYDEPKMGSIVGKEKAREYFSLQSSDFGDLKLSVSVQEGSLIPKDAMSRRQEAVELWGAGALDPITLFSALDFPNPRETAKMLFQWQTNPASLFPDIQAQMQQEQMMMAAQGAAPVPGGSSGGAPPPPEQFPAPANASTALPLQNV